MPPNNAIEIKVLLDWEELRDTLAALGTGELPNVQEAVEQGSLLIQKLWMEAASGVAVSYKGRSFVVRRRSGAYARSIQEGLEYPADSNPFMGRVAADAEYAAAIEQGTPAHDMKPALLGSSKARVSREGRRYVIIPFRHNVPTAGATGQPMPVEIYKQAKKLAFSQVSGRKMELNADRNGVQRFTYKWGGRLGDVQQGWRSRIAPAGREYTHKTSIYSGMVRMGQKGQTSYMTFRVVSEASPANSWWSPGSEPKPISLAVAEQAQPQVEALIRDAFEKDLKALEG